MTKMIAIHEVIRDGKNGRETVSPGAPFDATEAEAELLESLGAAKRGAELKADDEPAAELKADDEPAAELKADDEPAAEAPKRGRKPKAETEGEDSVI